MVSRQPGVNTNDGSLNFCGDLTRLSVMSSNAPETKTIRVNCLTIKLYGICLEFICCVLVLLGLCGFWFDVLFNLTI